MKIIEHGKGWCDCLNVVWVRTIDRRLMTIGRYRELYGWVEL